MTDLELERIRLLANDIADEISEHDQRFRELVAEAVASSEMRTKLLKAELNRLVGLVEKAGGDPAELRVDRALANGGGPLQEMGQRFIDASKARDRRALRSLTSLGIRRGGASG